MSSRNGFANLYCCAITIWWKTLGLRGIGVVSWLLRALIWVLTLKYIERHTKTWRYMWARYPCYTHNNQLTDPWVYYLNYQMTAFPAGPLQYSQSTHFTYAFIFAIIYNWWIEPMQQPRTVFSHVSEWCQFAIFLQWYYNVEVLSCNVGLLESNLLLHCWYQPHVHGSQCTSFIASILSLGYVYQMKENGKNANSCSALIHFSVHLSMLCISMVFHWRRNWGTCFLRRWLFSSTMFLNDNKAVWNMSGKNVMLSAGKNEDLFLLSWKVEDVKICFFKAWTAIEFCEEVTKSWHFSFQI